MSRPAVSGELGPARELSTLCHSAPHLTWQSIPFRGGGGLPDGRHGPLDGPVSIMHAGKGKLIAMTVPATMRALQQTSVNGPQDMRLITDVPVPVPGRGEVLIRVTAAGVNFADISQARGAFRGGPRPPYLAGFEGAGEIAAAGEAVTGLEPGARVIGTNVVGYG